MLKLLVIKQKPGLVYSSQNGANNYTVGTEGPRNWLQLVLSNWKKLFSLVDCWVPIRALGAIEDNITTDESQTGEMVFGHSDIDADDYFTYSRTKRNYSVDDVWR